MTNILFFHLKTITFVFNSSFIPLCIYRLIFVLYFSFDCFSTKVVTFLFFMSFSFKFLFCLFAGCWCCNCCVTCYCASTVLFYICECFLFYFILFFWIFFLLLLKHLKGFLKVYPETKGCPGQNSLLKDDYFFSSPIVYNNILLTCCWYPHAVWSTADFLSFFIPYNTPKADCVLLTVHN